MSYPTKELSWQYLVNVAVGGAEAVKTQNFIWHLKNGLVTFGQNPWTVVSSSNTSSSGAADYWTSQGTIVNQAWIVLKSGNGSELLLQANTGGVGAGKGGMWFSPSGAFTGGDTTTAPTATDQITIIDAQTAWGPWGESGDTTGWLHILHDTTGKHTRVIACTQSVCAWVGLFDEIIPTPEVTLTYPNTACIIHGTLYDASGTWTQLHTGQYIVTLAGAASVSLSMGGETFGSVGPATLTTVMGTTGNWAVCPITGLWSTTPGQMGKYAIPSSANTSALPDVLWGSSTIVTGSGYLVPITNSRDWVQFSNLVLPWNNEFVNIT